LDNKNDGTVTGEVKSRLEDLFGEGGKAPVFMEDGGTPEDSSLRSLKAIVLSVDWEIDDEVMGRLLEEIDRLEDTYKDDKTLVSFFRLFGSVAAYIKTRKGNAHPGAIKLLNSVYNSLEKVLLSKDITQAEKKQILVVQVKEFKKLKEQIASRKADTAGYKEVKSFKETAPVIEEQKNDVLVQVGHRPPEEPTEELLRSEMSRMTPQEALAYILVELKQVIRAEFKALKAELKS
jgi:hypothetical protein